MTAIDLSKQQAHNTDPTATQHINYTVNLDRDVDTRMLFILAKQKKRNYFRLFTRKCKSIVNMLYNNLTYLISYVNIN